MRILVLLFVSNILFISSCQAAQPQSEKIKLQKVPRIVYEIYTNEWYQTQAVLWKKEIDKNPQNNEAWYNYYNANRYARFEDIDSKERQEKLEQIISDMDKVIPDSYEYHLLKYWTKCDVEDIAAAQETYSIDPDRPDTYYTFLRYYTLTGDIKNLKMFAQKLYDSRDIEPWLYYYNYNVLMSLEPDAILVTNGDNDTYPIWVLQQVQNIRRDVTVINISLLIVENYFKNTLKAKYPEMEYTEIQQAVKIIADDKDTHFQSAFIQETVNQLSKKYQETPLFFAVTVYGQHTKPFADDLYLTGLSYRYAQSRFDNLAHLIRNMENNFLLDYLNFGLYNETRTGKNLAARIERNYLPGMMMLAEHYRNSGQEQQAKNWIDFAVRVAESSGFDEALDEIHKKFK